MPDDTEAADRPRASDVLMCWIPLIVAAPLLWNAYQLTAVAGRQTAAARRLTDQADGQDRDTAKLMRTTDDRRSVCTCPDRP